MMRSSSRMYDILFILGSALFLTVLNEFGYLEKAVLWLPLIWMLIAYRIGRSVERRFSGRANVHFAATRSNN